MYYKTLSLSIALLAVSTLNTSCKKDPPEKPDKQSEPVNLVTSDAIPSSIIFKEIPAQTFTMGSSSIAGSEEHQTSNPEHQVSLIGYEMTETEITNEQYVEFLNAALADGVIEVITATVGPETGQLVVVGTNKSNYQNKTFYSLEGTRVLKDHDNADLEDPKNEFTGDVEPENPLNIAFIGYDSSSKLFYIKNPHNSSDFNWR